jgi:predicted AlkP superfamily pyrophosphatase or phosphodiesterase
VTRKENLLPGLFRDIAELNDFSLRYLVEIERESPKMNELNNISLTRFASTVSAIMGIDPPDKADKPVEAIVSLYKGKADRVLIYNPDAIAMWLYTRYFDYFAPVIQNTPVVLPFLSVLPTVTPVCFATKYTGVTPDIHGIQSYIKPVVKTDSLFDAFIRSGQKIAIVAVENSSMSKIFAERDMDYYIEASDNQVCEKAKSILGENYDLICVYTSEYDAVMHKTGITSALSIAALKNQIAIYRDLIDGVKITNLGRKTLITFSPDHGVHDNEDESVGTHGSDKPEDLNILHFWGLV